jgi:hypothetical protein
MILNIINGIQKVRREIKLLYFQLYTNMLTKAYYSRLWSAKVDCDWLNVPRSVIVGHVQPCSFALLSQMSDFFSCKCLWQFKIFTSTLSLYFYLFILPFGWLILRVLSMLRARVEVLNPKIYLLSTVGALKSAFIYCVQYRYTSQRRVR